jgi:hypothetical protein
MIRGVISVMRGDSCRLLLLVCLFVLVAVGFGSCAKNNLPVLKLIGPDGGEVVRNDGFLWVSIPRGVLPSLVEMRTESSRCAGVP